jgi:hypothetical protein
MRYIIYLLTLSTTLISFYAHAKPLRRTIERDRSHSHRNTHSPPRRRRVIKATPAVHNSPQRSLVSAKPHRSKVQRHGSQRRSSERVASFHRTAQSKQRRVERRQQRRVERRQQRRVESRQQRRVERREQRRIERRQQRRIERRQQRRIERRQQRRIERRQQRRIERRQQRRIERRQIPVYAFAPPIRFIVNQHPRPHHNDDLFFDAIYHDGERYGINGDFRDEDQSIERGIQKGLITPAEASRLHRLLWDAYYLEDRCIADGYLTEEEEADLYWAERELNRSIRWEMKDFETW